MRRARGVSPAVKAGILLARRLSETEKNKKIKSVAAPGDFIPQRRMVSLALECKTLNLAS